MSLRGLRSQAARIGNLLGWGQLELERLAVVVHLDLDRCLDLLVEPGAAALASSTSLRTPLLGVDPDVDRDVREPALAYQPVEAGEALALRSGDELTSFFTSIVAR